MPKYKVEILTPALNDIDKIADYHLIMVGPVSAQKITDKILSTIEILVEYPEAGSEHPDIFLSKQGYRKIISGDYVCIYKVIEEVVYIYRVVHGAMDYPKLLR